VRFAIFAAVPLLCGAAAPKAAEKKTRTAEKQADSAPSVPSDSKSEPGVLLSPVPAAASAAKPSASRERLAVLDFSAAGVEQKIASSFARLLAAELSRSGAYEVMATEDVAALLGLERQRQLMGCREGACLSDVGVLLDTRFVVTGAVTGAGRSTVVNAQLLDAQRGRVVNRAALRLASEDDIAAQASPVAHELLAEPAVLQLYNQTQGVSVFLDDRFVGTMPLAPTPVKGTGTHRLRLEGDDFLPFETDIVLEPGRVTRLRAGLERLEDVESAARWRRWGGRGALALGAGLAAACGLTLRSAFDLKSAYDAMDPLRTPQARFDAAAADARTRFGFGYGLGGAALAAAAAGVWLLVVDPYADRLGTRPAAATAASIPSGTAAGARPAPGAQ